MKAGNTSVAEWRAVMTAGVPQWSPAMKAGNTSYSEDVIAVATNQPQWSPAMKAGNTTAQLDAQTAALKASMEPGHEGREYRAWTDE